MSKVLCLLFLRKNNEDKRKDKIERKYSCMSRTEKEIFLFFSVHPVSLPRNNKIRKTGDWGARIFFKQNIEL